MFNATWGVLAYHFLVPRLTAIVTITSVTAVWTAMEIARVRLPWLNEQVRTHPLFRRMLRPGEEERISGAVWFGWGVVAILVLFPRPSVEVGALVMGFGDGAAQIVGSHWGRNRLLAGRSLEGSLAFVAFAFVAVLAFRLWRYPELALSDTLLLAGATALLGALLEAVSVRVNDNVVVPVGVAGLAALLLA